MKWKSIPFSFRPTQQLQLQVKRIRGWLDSFGLLGQTLLIKATLDCIGRTLTALKGMATIWRFLISLEFAMAASLMSTRWPFGMTLLHCRSSRLAPSYDVDLEKAQVSLHIPTTFLDE